MARDNLFELFGTFWNAADDVRRLVRYGNLQNSISYFTALDKYAGELANAMDEYEHAQEQSDVDT